METIFPVNHLNNSVVWVLVQHAFFQVSDMLLMDWQVDNNSFSKNGDRQSDYYLEKNFYWNTNWNENERKFMIPFEKHPKSNAQVCYIFSLLTFLRITLNRMKLTVCINTSKILSEPSSLLSEHLKKHL